VFFIFSSGISSSVAHLPLYCSLFDAHDELLDDDMQDEYDPEQSLSLLSQVDDTEHSFLLLLLLQSSL